MSGRYEGVSVTLEWLSQQSLEELEFGKILELLVPFALTDRAAENLRSLRPRTDSSTIVAELAAIEELRLLHQRGEDIPLLRTDDPRTLLHRSMIAGAMLTANELLTILEVLGVSRSVKLFLSQRAELLLRLAEYARTLIDGRVLKRHIRDAIDPTGFVRDDASPDLRRIRATIGELSARLRSKLRRIVQRLGDEDLLQDEFYTQRDGRLVVPLKVEYKRSLPGIIHGVSQSGATVFFEPSEVFELNNELAELHAAEEHEIRRVLQSLTAEVGASADEILVADQTLTELDSLRARALFADQYSCVQPRIVDDGTIELRNAYHPLLVVGKGRQNVVPLSVFFDREHRGYLISGPNAGGKSIAIKVIGVSIVMALAGIYPLGELTVTPVTILAAIGDHQSIESNLSTFSSQLVRLRDIVAHSREHTMVIVDEICSGTDPNEGSALAAAIIDAILDGGAYIVATTHQFTLKTYALARPHLLNASMEFDTSSMQPTYRFMPGVPGNSYALELARALQLPDTIIERAQQYLGDKHARIEESIAHLQQLHTEIQKRLASAAEHEQRAKHAREQYEAKFQQFKAKYNQLIDAAASEARELVRETREQLKQIQQRATTESINAVRNELHVLEQALQSRLSEQHSYLAPTELSIGEWVEIVGTQQKGRVIEVTPKRVLVEVGAMRIHVAPENLRRTSPPQQQQMKRRPLKLDAAATVDVRGMRAQDALRTIETALNDAVLGGISQVTIIHGAGSGQLRHAVHEYLQGHPLVAGFHLGGATHSNWGETIVQLR